MENFKRNMEIAYSDLPTKELAEQYGLTPQAVYRIRKETREIFESSIKKADALFEVVLNTTDEEVLFETLLNTLIQCKYE